MRPFWQRFGDRARTLKPVAEVLLAAAVTAVVAVGLLFAYQWQRGLSLMAKELWVSWQTADNHFSPVITRL